MSVVQPRKNGTISHVWTGPRVAAFERFLGARSTKGAETSALSPRARSRGTVRSCRHPRWTDRDPMGRRGTASGKQQRHINGRSRVLPSRPIVHRTDLAGADDATSRRELIPAQQPPNNLRGTRLRGGAGPRPHRQLRVARCRLQDPRPRHATRRRAHRRRAAGGAKIDRPREARSLRRDARSVRGRSRRWSAKRTTTTGLRDGHGRWRPKSRASRRRVDRARAETEAQRARIAGMYRRRRAVRSTHPSDQTERPPRMSDEDDDVVEPDDDTAGDYEPDDRDRRLASAADPRREPPPPRTSRRSRGRWSRRHRIATGGIGRRRRGRAGGRNVARVRSLGRRLQVRRRVRVQARSCKAESAPGGRGRGRDGTRPEGSGGDERSGLFEAELAARG